MSALSLFLSLVLIVAAAHKLLNRDRLAMAVSRLIGLPLSTAMLASYAAAAVEALAALSLLFAETHQVGGTIAAALWLGYAILLSRRLGQSLDCGCSLGRREKPVSVALIARAFGLSALALIAAFAPHEAISVETLFAALGFLALYLALDELLALPLPVWRTH